MKTTTDQGGFALVEALVTAVVVTIGMLMIGQMMVVGTAGTRNLRERSVVTNVANRELELARAEGYQKWASDVSATADAHNLNTSTLLAVNFMTGKTLGDGGATLPAMLPPGYKIYTLTREISLRENSLNTDWDNQIQITVELASAQSAGKAVRVATMLNRNL
jgi:type II secretory pathway pseudopilin PulG